MRIDKNDRVVPTSVAYVPNLSSELLRVSFQNVADHIATIDFNDQNKPNNSRLELVVKYDNVSESGAEAFRALSRDKAKSLLVYLDKFLAVHDGDTNDSQEDQNGTRTGLGIYYFEDKPSND